MHSIWTLHAKSTLWYHVLMYLMYSSFQLKRECMVKILALLQSRNTGKQSRGAKSGECDYRRWPRVEFVLRSYKHTCTVHDRISFKTHISNCNVRWGIFSNMYVFGRKYQSTTNLVVFLHNPKKKSTWSSTIKNGITVKYSKNLVRSINGLWNWTCGHLRFSEPARWQHARRTQKILFLEVYESWSKGTWMLCVSTFMWWN